MKSGTDLMRLMQERRAVIIGFLGILLGVWPSIAASGLFPKMPPATNVFVANCQNDEERAHMAAWALQGMINQSSAEVFIADESRQLEQLGNSGKAFIMLPSLTGRNAGLRTLFKKYQARVKTMVLYDPEKDWTWYLALMKASQLEGIPVTESIKSDLTREFDWKGEVFDFQNRWTNRTAAYDWALTNLMPECNKQVVYWLEPRRLLPLIDYVAASKGFIFWLDRNQKEQPEIEKIFRTKGYGVGTSLMGYGSGGDEANTIANRRGIGYVVSDLYANGSYWSSFPNKTYTQTPGKAVPVHPGKIYASVMWSDGDNIQFDQNPLFDFWHDDARGTIPVATSLSPTLQELNSPLLDWYYSKSTDNDELMAGPAGVQFVFIRDFKEDLFPAWCRLTRNWCRDAGFGSVRIWIAPNPSAKFTTYMQTCGFSGVIGEGLMVWPGFPPKIETYAASNEEELYKQFTTAVTPNPQSPVFVNFTCIVAGFNEKNGGYSAIKRQMQRLEKAYPGRYEFLLPKDQFATMRAYYHLPRSP